MAKAKVSQKSRMVAFMAKGRTLSPTQARTMFKAQKPSARVRELRLEGFNVVSTQNKSGNFAYALGGI